MIMSSNADFDVIYSCSSPDPSWWRLSRTQYRQQIAGPQIRVNDRGDVRSRRIRPIVDGSRAYLATEPR